MTMDIFQGGLLFLAAGVAGAVNAVAGGGSFISFPTLMLTGMAPVSANATNAAALWPGSAASVGAYRRELGRQRGHLLLFSMVSVVGGLLGALLLLRTKDALFAQMIPYLMLGATLIFAASPAITRMAGRGAGGTGGPLRRAAVILLYLGVAIYGGFFGAGLGILTLAVLGLLGFEDIHEMNAMKTLQATVINGVAVAAFVIAGVVQWPQMLVMTVGAIIGGYGGAALARRLPAGLVRGVVLAVGLILTVIYFVRG